MKQSFLAELLGVTQATVSRWEHGFHDPDPEQAAKLEEMLSVPLDSSGHAGLRWLVEASALPVHLVCDATHRLLAASPAREAAWGVSARELRGQSLWRFASDEVREIEVRLPDAGWYETRAPAGAGWTDGNRGEQLRILPQVFLWERMTLDDGTAVRIDRSTSLESLKHSRPDAKGYCRQRRGFSTIAPDSCFVSGLPVSLANLSADFHLLPSARRTTVAPHAV